MREPEDVEGLLGVIKRSKALWLDFPLFFHFFSFLSFITFIMPLTLKYIGHLKTEEEEKGGGEGGERGGGKCELRRARRFLKIRLPLPSSKIRIIDIIHIINIFKLY